MARTALIAEAGHFCPRPDHAEAWHPYRRSKRGVGFFPPIGADRMQTTVGPLAASSEAASVKSALHPREGGFAKFGQLRASMSVNDDHAQSPVLEQDRIRKRSDRIRSISDGV